jgi:serine protease Do
MRKVNLKILVILLLALSGCKGCSQSGLRSEQRKANNTTTYQSDYKSGNTKKAKEYNPPNSLGDLFNRHKSAIFLVYTSNDKDTFQGSGFFVSPNGIAVSNYHIFEGTFKGNEVIVTSSGKELHIKKVLEKNEDKDYIIFKVGDVRNMNYLSISQAHPAIGEEVFAIGNPRGLEHTLSTGIISGYRREKQLIQTTAEITHGSSGGALLNMKGEVIGITSSGFGEANLNFAINIQKLPLNKFIK